MFFLSGWTFALYMALPAVRIFAGIQPLTGGSAAQFLVHVAPYFCLSLAVTRRSGRFVVTAKQGVAVARPRTVQPALAVVVALTAAIVTALAVRTDASTINNAAFAVLHVSVLLAGSWAALVGIRGTRRAAGDSDNRRAAAGTSPPHAPVAPGPRSGGRPGATSRHPPPSHRPPTGPVGRSPGGRSPCGRTTGDGRHRHPAAATLTTGRRPGRGWWPATPGCHPQDGDGRARRHRLLRTDRHALPVGIHRPRPPRPPPTLTALARRDARAFLARHVVPDGRVVRRDQGGDTVSEGQGYALLVALAIGDQRAFRRVWHWEERNLQLPSGLFAYHWAHGRLSHGRPRPTPARTRPGRSCRQGRASTTRPTPPTVAAWPAPSSPTTAPPSSTRSSGRWPRTCPTWPCPPQSGPTASPTRSGGRRAADGKGRAVYGLGTQRVPIWFASDCAADGRVAARRTWHALRSAKGAGGRIAYRLDDRPLSQDLNPVRLVVAAAADAAGHRADGQRLLARADRQNAVYRTYYGSAWLALGRILLDTSRLSRCPPG